MTNDRDDLKITHYFSRSIFLRSFVVTLNKHFSTMQHVFFITGNDHSSDLPYPECFKDYDVYDRNWASFCWKKFKEPLTSNLIIIHQLQFDVVILLFILPILLKKTVWVIWGGDLYDYLTYKSSYRQKVSFLLKKFIVKRIPYVVARTPDFKLLQKWYGSKAEHLIVEPFYTSGEYDTALLHIRENTTSPLKITLGNSATETNRHMAALDLLSKYKNENLQIYIPLSYGDPEYAKTVATKAKEIFGDKVVVLDQFMPPEEYNKHLSEMDIGIFNHNRQQALGNIAYLLASGAKIYLNNDSPLWEIYDEMKFHIHSINTIQGMSYNNFSYLDQEELAENSKMAKIIYSEKHGVECWTRVFNLAKNNKKILK